MNNLRSESEIKNVQNKKVKEEHLIGNIFDLKSFGETKRDQNIAIQMTSDDDFLCPEWFGAKGDGKTDDREAFEQCLSRSSKIRLQKKTYCICSKKEKKSVFQLNGNLFIEGNGAEILLPDKLYDNYNSSLDLFADRQEKNNFTKQIKDLKITVEVNKPRDFSGNFYLFHFYSEKIDLSNVKVVNRGKNNGLTVLTVNYSKNVNIDGCVFDNQSLSKIGGVIWVMQKESVEGDGVNIKISNSEFIHDAKDETICFSSSGSNKSSCKIVFDVDNCKFKSPNKVQGSGFFIFYDNRKEGLYKYRLKGTVRNTSFLSQKGVSVNFRRVFSIQRGDAVSPSWEVLFDNCDFLYEEDYNQENGYDGKWACNYVFCQPTNKHIKNGDFSLKITNSRIKTNNSVFNAYTGGGGGDIVLENCQVECKALRVANANGDQMRTNFVFRNSSLLTEYPYSYGGNEEWSHVRVSSNDANFFLVAFCEKVYQKKLFEDCIFNGTPIEMNFSEDDKQMKVNRYCAWRHSIGKTEFETIHGILSTENYPQNVNVNSNLVIKK